MEWNVEPGAGSELLVVLLRPDRTLPEGAMRGSSNLEAKVRSAAAGGGWRASTDGVAQMLDVADSTGVRVMMLVAAGSASEAVRAAAADLSGSGVFPFFTDAQVADVPEAEFFDIAIRFGVPVLLDSWSGTLVEQMLAAAARGDSSEG